MMTVIIDLLALIGAFVVGLFAWTFAKEALRAWRQSCRILGVMERLAHGREIPTPWHKRLYGRWRQFKGEMFSIYSAKRIAGIELPHDPKKPLGHERF